MSKDDKKVSGTITLPLNDSTKVLQEINFDAWDANGMVVTINNDSPISTHGTDTITIDTSSNGITQGDLFNGWPEDGAPVTVTVNLDEELIPKLKD